MLSYRGGRNKSLRGRFGRSNGYQGQGGRGDGYGRPDWNKQGFRTNPETGIRLLDYRKDRPNNADDMQKWSQALKKKIMEGDYAEDLDNIFDMVRHERQQVLIHPDANPGNDENYEWKVVTIHPEYPNYEEPEPLSEEESNNELLAKKYLFSWQEYRKNTEKLRRDKIRVFGLIQTHQTAASEQRTLSYEGGSAAKSSKDPLAYLKVIIASHATTGRAHPMEAFYEAQRYYNNIIMGEEEWLTSYTERFEATARAYVEAAHMAELDDLIHNSALQTMHYIKTLNSRYDEYRDSVENSKNDDYPTQIQEAFGQANDYSTVKTRWRDRQNSRRGRGGHINAFVAPRGGRGGGGNYGGYRGEGRGNYGRGGYNNNDYSNNKPSKPVTASEDSACYNCGSTDHWAASCPHKSGGGRGGGGRGGRGGRGYLHSEGTQKLVEKAVTEGVVGGGAAAKQSSKN